MLATVALLYPGFGTSDPNASLPAHWTRSAYEVSQFVPLGALILLGLVFYAAGAPTRRQLAEVPIAPEPVTTRAVA
jgi:hypothetical protein